MFNWAQRQGQPCRLAEDLLVAAKQLGTPQGIDEFPVLFIVPSTSELGVVTRTNGPSWPSTVPVLMTISTKPSGSVAKRLNYRLRIFTEKYKGRGQRDDGKYDFISRFVTSLFY